MDKNPLAVFLDVTAVTCIDTCAVTQTIDDSAFLM